MIRVVVVDDEHEIRQVVSEFLTTCMGDVEVVAQASDGVEAIEMVERHRPDLLLTDVRMPRLDGLQVARLLAEDARNRHLRIISWSSLAEESLARRSHEAGIERHLAKPFALSALQVAIRSPQSVPEDMASRVGAAS